MPILTLALATLPGQLRVALACLSERLDLGVVSLSIRAERLYKVNAFWLYGPDRLCPSVKETLHHRWFVRALDASVKPIVCRLECHLYKGVGRESVSGDERLAVALELERLTIVLTDQVGDPRLGESYSSLELGREFPSELFGCKLEVLVRLDFLVGFCLVMLALW